MDEAKQPARADEETDADRLRGILAPDALSIELISAFAGDRPLTEGEAQVLTVLKSHRGKQFFSDLLYAITHQYFAPPTAESLWAAILQHKYEMSKSLRRNTKIAVAALDYLSNLKGDLCLTTLVGEAHIAKIVGRSMRDGLTGLYNHTSCFEILSLELKRYGRYGICLSLIFADIDDFKQVNDRRGHQAGDQVLAELAALLEAETRDTDVCCRYGGEEFAVILPCTKARDAGEIAERIRKSAKNIRHGDWTLSVSFGVASCDARTPTLYAFIEKADRALYRAKRNGKNRVEVIE